MPIRRFAASLVLIATVACSGPADNKPQAVVKDAVPPKAAAPAATPAATPVASAPKSMDPAMQMPVVAETQYAAPAVAVAGAEYVFTSESKIEFTGSSMRVKNDGAFTSISGRIALVDNKPEASSVKVAIDMNSTSTKVDRLTNHLKSADFFDVAKFPKSTFESTKIESMADHFMIGGNLSLHGVTKNITFPAKIQIANGEIRAQADFTVKRFDFGIVYNGTADNLISDDVAIRLNIVAKPKP